MSDGGFAFSAGASRPWRSREASYDDPLQSGIDGTQIIRIGSHHGLTGGRPSAPETM